MMKKMMMTAVLTAMVVAAQAMSFSQARQEALFLSDKMAYELGLTYSQYEAVYEINLDYFLCIYTEADMFGVNWNRRNTDLRYVLNEWQYRQYITTVDFYQPVRWYRGSWTFSIYTRYGRNMSYRQPPRGYDGYRGGRNQGTISFYRNVTIRKPDGRPQDPGRPVVGGQGNHFPQTGGSNARPPQQQDNRQFGTNNRNTGTGNTGTRHFGTSAGTSAGSSAGAGKPSGTGTTPPAKPSTSSGSSKPAASQQAATPSRGATSNGSGTFGGARKK